jgi:hypothetical protein
MKRVFALLAALATVALIGTAVATATVSYDPSSGGTVGKGDVQNALGLNDVAVQTAPVTFGYWNDRYYPWSWTCTNGDLVQRRRVLQGQLRGRKRPADYQPKPQARRLDGREARW